MNTTVEYPKKKSLINWGSGIAIVIIVAASAMIFLVYQSMQVNFDMVSNNYYADELVHNQKMTAQDNAKKLATPIEINQTTQYFIIKFPLETIGNIQQGTIKFYRPSDATKDIHVPISLDKEGIMVVDKKQMINGLYNIQIEWDMNKQSYLYTDDFIIEK